METTQIRTSSQNSRHQLRARSASSNVRLILGVAVNTLGNITPAVECNFWVDLDAAAIVMDAFETTPVDWGLICRDSTFDVDEFDEIEATETRLAAFR